jgi:nitrite reductase/ring-hydroxylating ferredoxin subunit
MAEVDRSEIDRIKDGVMSGETPLQVLARSGGAGEPSRMRSIARVPYYTSFPFSWYRACASEDLPIGAVKPARYLNRDLVVWRGEDGEAHVMDAYCPHLGAHLGYGGRVAGCELVCPFHWWRFDGEGRNTSIPYLATRNASARIATYPTVERNGFVLFWYHPTGVAPLWEIPRLEEYGDSGWTSYHHAGWLVRAPWQELAENGPDFVHLRTVHGAVRVPELEAYDLDGYCARLRARVTFDTPRGPSLGRIDTDSWGAGFGVARFSGIIDALFVAVNTPIDFEVTEVSFNYMVKNLGDSPESLERTRRVGEALIRDLEKQEAEDIVIFDHKIHVANPKLSGVDAPIMKFRAWARQFYVDGDPRGTNR